MKGQKSQTLALHRVVDHLDDLPGSSRAVLRVICEMADGAGFCWPSVNRLIRESGYKRRSVFRAFKDLERRGYLDYWPQLRDPARYRSHLPQSAQVGQGLSIYRVGERLRAVAGLRHVDVNEHLRLESRGAQIDTMAPPDNTAVSSLVPRVPPREDGTPELHPRTHPLSPANTAFPEDQQSHPSTDNGKPFISKETVVSSARDQQVQSVCDGTLRTTTEIVAALPPNEALVVLEAEALVDAGAAEWLERGWPS